MEPEDLDGLLQGRAASVRVVDAPQKSVCFLVFNGAGALARVPEVARALGASVRTHDLVRSTLGRLAQPAEGLLPPGILGHDPNRRRQPATREEAAEALRASGLALPLRLRAAISPTVQGRYAGLLEALLTDWRALGVEVAVATPTMEEYLRASGQGEGIDLLIQEWIADYADPDNFTYALFHSEAGLLRSYYSSEALDRLMEQARAERRPPAREALYRRVEEHLRETGLVVPLLHGIDYRAASAGVRRLALRSAPPYVNYAEVAKVGTATRAAAREALQIPLEYSVESCDPCRVLTIGAAEAALTVFETLLRAGAGARVEPWLAAEWRAEAGGRTYYFRLRPDVRFHDGRRLTSRDVRFSIERMVQSGSEFHHVYGAIRGAPAVLRGEAGALEGLRILSDTELTIELERPLAIFPALLTSAVTAIVPEGTREVTGSWREGCVGTGAFRVARFEPGRRLELEANPLYWRRGYPASERLLFSLNVSPSETVSGLREGRFALAPVLSRAEAEALRRDPQFAARVYGNPAMATYFILLNSHRGPLVDEALRRRLLEAVDVEQFVRGMELPSQPAHSLIPPGLLGYEPRREAASRPARPAPGDEVELTCVTTTATSVAVEEILVPALRERGMRARVVADTTAGSLAAIEEGTVDLAVIGWNCDYPDADSIVTTVLHSKGGIIGRLVGSPELDRLCERGRTETAPGVRHEIYREIEDLVRRRALLLPLLHPQQVYAARPGVEGLELNLFQPYLSYEKLRARGEGAG
jgi:ABC-type transport system substrate-binding protein